MEIGARGPDRVVLSHARRISKSRPSDSIQDLYVPRVLEHASPTILQTFPVISAASTHDHPQPIGSGVTLGQQLEQLREGQALEDYRRLVRDHNRLNPLPRPPAAPLSVAIETWRRLREQTFGLMLNPPETKIDPAWESPIRFMRATLERLIGNGQADLRVYDGDVFNAFATRHEDLWKESRAEATTKEVDYGAAWERLKTSLDPGGQGTAAEIGITTRAYKTCKNASELAFLMAHETAHLTEGHLEPQASEWISSQAFEVVADDLAFDRCLEADYDPAAGVHLLRRLFQDRPSLGLDTVKKALKDGKSSHHHEGVRVALAQLKLESLRRTDPRAHPDRFSPQELPTGASLPSKPLSRHVEGAVEAAEALIRGEPIYPRGEFRVSPREKGQAFVSGLRVLADSDLDSGAKVGGALRLFLALSRADFEGSGHPELSPEQVHEARSLLQGLDFDIGKLGFDYDERSELVFKVQLSRSFQEVIEPFYQSDPNWRQWVDAAPGMAVHPHLPKLVGCLGGMPPQTDMNYRAADVYYPWEWPEGVVSGTGPLDDVHRANLLGYLDSLAPSDPTPYLQESANGFDEAVSERLAPCIEAYAHEREQQVKKAAEGDGYLPLALKAAFAGSDRIPWTQATGPYFDAAFQRILDEPCWNLDKPDEQPHFLDYLEKQYSQADSEGRSKIRRLVLGNAHLDRLPRGRLDSIGRDIAKNSKSYLSSHPHIADNALSLLNRQSEFDQPPSTEERERLHWWIRMGDGGRDLRAYYLRHFAARQSEVRDLKDWSREVSPCLGPRVNRTLDGQPDLRAQLGEALYERLLKRPATELCGWLQEDVTSLLDHHQRADILVRSLDVEATSCPEKLAQLRQECERKHQLADSPRLQRLFHSRLAEVAGLQPSELRLVIPPDERSRTERAQTLSKEVRGLSALVGACRTRNEGEQLHTIEYLMGWRSDLPGYVDELDQQMKLTGDKTLMRALQESRGYLSDSEREVRTGVAASLLAGPNGLLEQPSGRQLLIDRFLQEIAPERREVARTLAEALLETHRDSDAVAVGFLLAQPPGASGRPTEGSLLNSLFDAFGTPGIKLKQYLAFTSEFKQFRTYFEESQDSALPLNYLEALDLVEHHFGDRWPSHWKLEGVKGSGSVNVALRYYDEQVGEHRIVTLPRKNIEAASNYDFWRLNHFLDALCKTPANEEKFGFLKGLVGVIQDSVELEYDRPAAFAMQRSVEPFYRRKVHGWEVRSAPAYELNGQAISMAEAPGQTARRTLQSSPVAYRSAMKALGEVEQDALYGLADPGMNIPTTLHANPDVHDGQALIDVENRIVTLIDFGQALACNNEQRDYGVDLLAILGKAHQPEKAAALLSARSGTPVSAGELAPILAREEMMDGFVRLLSLMSEKGARIPLPTVHWVLGVNRQRVLGEKIGRPIDKRLKLLVGTCLKGGGLADFNAVRISRRAPFQAARAGLLLPAAGWLLRFAGDALGH